MQKMLKSATAYIGDKRNIIAFIFGILCGTFSIFGFFPFSCAFICSCYMNKNCRISSSLGVIVGIIAKNEIFFIFPLAFCSFLCIIWIRWLGNDKIKNFDWLLILAISQLTAILFRHNNIYDCIGVIANCIAALALCTLMYYGFGSILKSISSKIPASESEQFYICLFVSFFVLLSSSIEISNFSLSIFAATIVVLLFACIPVKSAFYAIIFSSFAVGFGYSGFNIIAVATVLVAGVICSLFAKKGRLFAALIYCIISLSVGTLILKQNYLIPIAAGAIIFMIIPEIFINELTTLFKYCSCNSKNYRQPNENSEQDSKNDLLTRVARVAKAAGGMGDALMVQELSGDGQLAVRQLKAFAGVLGSVENNTVKKDPIIDVEVGMACIPKLGCAYTGDSIMKTENENITLIVLSDGMGSGLLAHNESSAAVNAFSEMINAGFGLRDSIDAVNRRLITNDNEDFYATLDSVIIDKTTSEATIVKMGSPQTCILRNNRVINISSEALPLGIVEDVEPTVKRIHLQSNDIIFMFTDGATDALGINLIADIIDLSSTNSTPTQFANSLMDMALSEHARDDISIVCIFVKDATADKEACLRIKLQQQLK